MNKDWNKGQIHTFATNLGCALSVFAFDYLWKVIKA